MAMPEIDSFVKKFKDLWKCGFDAHLDIDTHDGQAWVGLRVGLGAHGLLHPVNPSRCKSKDSPSRHRRRAKREEARQVLAEESQQDNSVTESESSLDATENVAAVAEETSENLETKKENHEEIDEKPEKAEGTLEIAAEIACKESIGGNLESMDTTETKKSSEIVQKEEETEVKINSEKTVIEVIEQEIIVEPSVEVVVFATAVIDNSTGEHLTQSELKNLQDLIFREKHLRVNILKLEYGPHFSRELRKNCFKHTIELRLHISTKNLWEGARSYVWRHFGQSEWSRGNGSSVVFNRIHVKSSP